MRLRVKSFRVFARKAYKEEPRPTEPTEPAQTERGKNPPSPREKYCGYYLLFGDVLVEISEMNDPGGFAALLLRVALGLGAPVVRAALPADRRISVAVRIHDVKMMIFSLS